MKSKYLVSLIFLTILTNQLFSQGYEIKHDTGSDFESWYGGDDSSGNLGATSYGIGQSILIESDITLTSFSWYFSNLFDYFENSGGFGHDVTLILQIRDHTGNILMTSTLDLPDSFYGGWATWENIDLSVIAGTTLIFTSYLEGGFDTNKVYTAAKGDGSGGFANGYMYLSDQSNAMTQDSDFDNWNNWYVYYDWDFHFWLTGTTQSTVGIQDSDSIVTDFSLSQNYPNPFNPNTTINYKLTSEAFVNVTIYDLLGTEVVQLINEVQPSGTYTINWNGRNSKGNIVNGGVYIYKLDDGTYSKSMKMVFLK